MANPTVEKLKEAGLLYGDKAAVALTSAAVRGLSWSGTVHAVHPTHA